MTQVQSQNDNMILKFVILIAPLLLFGCSRLNIALNWADTFVLSGLDDYYQFNSAQSAQFKSDFKLILHQVKKNEFQDFALHLDKIAIDVQNNSLTRDVIQGHITRGRDLFKNVIAKFEPLIQKVNDHQALIGFQKFDQEFTKKMESDIKELSDKKKSLKKLKASFNFWIDNSIEFLTETQEENLAKLLIEHPAPKGLQLESKQAVYSKFVQMRSESKARKEFIYKFMTDWESLQTKSYLLARKNHQELIVDWIYKLAQTLTDEQKQNLIEALKRRSLEFKQV